MPSHLFGVLLYCHDNAMSRLNLSYYTIIVILAIFTKKQKKNKTKQWRQFNNVPVGVMLSPQPPSFYFILSNVCQNKKKIQLRVIHRHIWLISTYVLVWAKLKEAHKKNSWHQNRNLMWSKSTQHEQPCLFTVTLPKSMCLLPCSISPFLL